MKCPSCQHDNEPEARYCEQCASPLAHASTNYVAALREGAKFCPQCAHPVDLKGIQPNRFDAPGQCIPKHLAEKILSSKSALEGERKQVAFLFADLKGSM